MKRKWHFLVPLFCFEYMLFEIISRKFVCLIGVKPLPCYFNRFINDFISLK